MINKEEFFSLITSKDTKEDYKKFCELETIVSNNYSYYNFIDDLFPLMNTQKSYHRLRIFRLICELSKFDNLNKVDKNIQLVLQIFNDQKPTVIRQALSSIKILIREKPQLSRLIIDKITNINLLTYKDTVRPLIEKDINILTLK